MNTKSLYKISVGIAKYLDGFKAIKPEGESWFVELAGPQNKSIYISEAKQRGRISIKGGYPDRKVNWCNHTPYNQNMPQITCACSRSHQAIAKDISRRLLPPYQLFITDSPAKSQG